MFKLKFFLTIGLISTSILSFSHISQNVNLSAKENEVSKIISNSQVSQSTTTLSLATSQISSVTSNSQQLNSLSVTNNSKLLDIYRIPKPVTIDPKIEKQVINCIRNKYDVNKKDIIITFLDKTKGIDLREDTNDIIDFGIAFSKDSNSDDGRLSKNYTFNIIKNNVKCRDVAETIVNLNGYKTKESIEEGKENWKKYLKSEKNREEKNIKDIEYTKEKKSTLLDIFSPVKASALTSSQIYQVESDIIQKGKDLGITNKNQAAYILGTAWHKSAQFNQLSELYNGTNKCTYFDQKYGPGTSVAVQLGNTQVGDGCKFYGRGYVQLTGRSNYQTYKDITAIDIINNPDLVATDTNFARFIMVDGMKNGRFTSVKLNDYINSTTNDFYNARKIVNGLDAASTIEGYTRNLYLTDTRITNYTTTPSTPTPIQAWMFKRKGTNQCLNSYNSANYSKVDTYTCNQSDGDQLWTNNGGGFRKKGSSFCMNSNSPTNAKGVIMWTCNSNNNDQNWNWSTNAFVRSGTSQCVDKQNPANGIQVYTWVCLNGNTNQQWEAIWLS